MTALAQSFYGGQYFNIYWLQMKTTWKHSRTTFVRKGRESAKLTVLIVAFIFAECCDKAKNFVMSHSVF